MLKINEGDFLIDFVIVRIHPNYSSFEF